jgi:hypothetical protein
MPTLTTPFYINSSASIRIINPTTLDISTLTLSGSDSLWVANGSTLNAGVGVNQDSLGNLYVAAVNDCAIYKISPLGVVVSLAGVHGVATETGVPGPASSAGLADPGCPICDAAGNVYFYDSLTGNILCINTQSTSQTLLGISIPAGHIAVVAGVGSVRTPAMNTAILCGNGGPATSAHISMPTGVDSFGYYFPNFAIDSFGNVFFMDDVALRRVDHSTGTISLVAGTFVTGSSTSSGDGGLATSAAFSDFGAWGVIADSKNNLYIMDGPSGQSFIRVINTTAISQTVLNTTIPAGYIQRVVGVGTEGNTGNGGAALSAEIGYIYWMYCDVVGNFFIGDVSTVRVITPTGIISAVAGTGTQGNTGDGGLATSAELTLHGITTVGSGVSAPTICTGTTAPTGNPYA